MSVALLLVFVLLVFAIQMWFCIILFKCYQYFYNEAQYGLPSFKFSVAPYQMAEYGTNSGGDKHTRKDSQASIGPATVYPQPAYPTRYSYPATQRGYYYQ